jgi:hypothetical protein
MDAPPPSGGMPYAHLEELLKQNLDVAKENHKILKRMERHALIGFIVKVVIWLIVLGVPLFLLSTYFAPLVSAFQNGTSTPSGLFGLPSPAEMKQILQTYKGQK